MSKINIYHFQTSGNTSLVKSFRKNLNLPYHLPTYLWFINLHSKKQQMESFFRRFTARYTISWLGFFGTLTVYFCRLNLSISIVSMVKQVEASSSSSSNSTLCPQSSDYFVQNISFDGERRKRLCRKGKPGSDYFGN